MKTTVHCLISAAGCQLCAGSGYQESCANCSFSEDGCVIRCECKDGYGVLQDSVIQLTPSSEEACLLDNDFGELNCSRLCPIETTAVSTTVAGE